jgi:hypothetical protein
MSKAFIICIRLDDKMENIEWYYDNFYYALKQDAGRLGLTISKNVELKQGTSGLPPGMFKVTGEVLIDQVNSAANSAAGSVMHSDVVVIEIADSPESIRVSPPRSPF